MNSEVRDSRTSREVSVRSHPLKSNTFFYNAFCYEGTDENYEGLNETHGFAYLIPSWVSLGEDSLEVS